MTEAYQKMIESIESMIENIEQADPETIDILSTGEPLELMSILCLRAENEQQRILPGGCHRGK